MKNLFAVAILLTQSFAFSAFADSTLSAGYKYISTEHDYQSSYLTYDYGTGRHRIGLAYERADGLNPQYSVLHRVGLSYLYMNDQHMFGTVAGSASDKPFNSIDVMDIMAFYGYSVYSKVLGTIDIPLPDGSIYKYERKSNLYLGVAAASKPLFFDTYAVPVVSFIYPGEKLMLRVGIPVTMISYTPHKMHRIDLLLGFVGSGITYEYTPTDKDKFSVSYINGEERSYRLSNQSTTDNNEGYQLVYLKDWYRASYSHTFNGAAEVGTSIGYMPLGYKFEGKYYKSGPSRRLPHETEYGVFVSMKF